MMKKVENTRLPEKLPFKFEFQRMAGAGLAIVVMMVTTIWMGRNAKFYSKPFAEWLQRLSGDNLDPAMVIVMMSLAVYAVMTVTLVFNVYLQARATAKTNMLEPEFKKLYDWGTEHVIYVSTYDQMKRRLLYMNHAAFSFSGLAAVSIFQAPITIGLLYTLRHTSFFNTAQFLGMNLSDKNVMIAIIVGGMYMLNTWLGNGTAQQKDDPKQVLIKNAMAILVGIMMFITVSATALGIGLYFFTGICVVMLRRVPLNWLRSYFVTYLTGRVKIKYDADYMLTEGSNIIINEEGKALDNVTGKPSKL